MSIDFEELSNLNVVRQNLGSFKRLLRHGVSSRLISQSLLSKWHKLGLIFYNRKKKLYYLTKYGNEIMTRVLKDPNLKQDY